MQPSFHHPSARLRRSAAFTVLELLVAVTILTLIVYSLYQMFNQTQKALRGNINQVDVMESGRAAMEMMTRELEQVGASDVQSATNLYVGMIPVRPSVLLDVDEKTRLRTNVLQEIFFLSQSNNVWNGIGYRVAGADFGVGTLYKFMVPPTNVSSLTASSLSSTFFTEPITNQVTQRVSTNFHRVADGVIHLRVTAYDQDGRRMGVDMTNTYPAYRLVKQGVNQTAVPLTNNVILRQEPFIPLSQGQTKLLFLSNALPSYLELELGVLSPDVLAKYDAIRASPAQASAATNFLAKQAAKVHLFRQRIPIRTSLQ